MANHKKGVEELNRVLAALGNLSPPNATCNEEIWPKTRYIAELCDINIYIARYYLMKLVKEKKASVSSRSINNSLRWYITESLSFPDTVFQVSSSTSMTVESLHHDTLDNNYTRKVK